ncbi:phosphodiester glycosidase family protein [candidate division KSB1 bacterium]|nr:phosphodiester glycosidase family protein [candidate division KSB1 bacterium]
MKLHTIVLLLLFMVTSLSAQTITWIEQTNSELPEGVKLYKGTRNTPKLQAFYLDVVLDNTTLAVRPYIVAHSDRVPDIVDDVGAYAAINGGFFGGSTSYSSVIYPGEVKARNVSALTRNSQSYPVIRSLFSVDTLNQLSVDWIYHFDNSLSGLYRYETPIPYSYNDPTPEPAPIKNDGQEFSEILVGIGGGPTLVKNGSTQITYDEEIFWGSGVGYDNRDPRTAIGHTAENHVIMFVADGRQSSISEGVSLIELADIMISLGCVEAMNLDGGGSTQMAIGDSYVNSPSEQRAVPTIFAITHFDSLGLAKEPLFEKIIDTADTALCKLAGEGWFPTANAGYWGESPSMLNQRGPGEAYAMFTPQLPTQGTYDVFGWWVAASNRCADTPFIIHHQDGVDTVRINQVNNGSTWSFIGTYKFYGDISDAVIISEAATIGTYIVADAVRFVSYDTTETGVESDCALKKALLFELMQNYPNPFNPQTKIRYQLTGSSHVQLSIFNTLGQNIAILVSDKQAAGVHEIHWDAGNYPSGVYYTRLETDFGSQMRKVLFLK